LNGGTFNEGDGFSKQVKNKTGGAFANFDSNCCVKKNPLTYAFEGRNREVFRRALNQLLSVQSGGAEQEIGAGVDVFFRELLPLTEVLSQGHNAFNLRAVSLMPLLVTVGSADER